MQLHQIRHFVGWPLIGTDETGSRKTGTLIEIKHDGPNMFATLDHAGEHHGYVFDNITLKADALVEHAVATVRAFPTHPDAEAAIRAAFEADDAFSGGESMTFESAVAKIEDAIDRAAAEADAEPMLNTPEPVSIDSEDQAARPLIVGGSPHEVLYGVCLRDSAGVDLAATLLHLYAQSMLALTKAQQSGSELLGRLYDEANGNMRMTEEQKKLIVEKHAEVLRANIVRLGVQVALRGITKEMVGIADEEIGHELVRFPRPKNMRSPGSLEDIAEVLRGVGNFGG